MLELLERTLRREAHVFTAEPRALASHLRNSLALEHGSDPAVAPLLGRAEAALVDRPWLRLVRGTAVNEGGGATLVRVLEHAGVGAIAWSPDGRRLATAGAGSVLVWDVRSGAQAAALDPGRPGGTELRAVAWSPDGEFLAWSGDDVPVTLHRLASGGSQVLEDAPPGARHLAWSPDGTRLAIGARISAEAGAGGGTIDMGGGVSVTMPDREGTVYLWDRLIRQTSPPLPGARGDVNGLAWSPDGTRLAAASGANAVLIWDARTFSLLGEGSHDTPIPAVAWSPDDRTLLYSGIDLMIAFIDLTTWQATPRGPLAASPFALAWSPDATIAAAGMSDGSLWFEVDGVSGGIQAQAASIRAIGFDPDGTLLASASGDGTVCLFDVDALLAEPAEEAAPQGHILPVQAVGWSPDGSVLASASTDSSVLLWGADDVAPGARLGHEGPVSAVAWDGRGQRLATGELALEFGDGGTTADGLPIQSTQRRGVVRLWDGGSHLALGSFPGVTEMIRAMAWSPDDAFLGVAAADGSVWVLDLRDGSLHEVAGGAGHEAISLAWSPDSMRLDAGTDSGVILPWSQTGQPVRPLACEGPVGALAWSPDGAKLAAGAARGTRVFEVPAFDRWTDLEALGAVRTLAWSEDAKRLAVGDSTRAVWVWDVAERRRLGGDWTASPIGTLRLRGTELQVADDGAAAGDRPARYRFELREAGM